MLKMTRLAMLAAALIFRLPSASMPAVGRTVAACAGAGGARRARGQRRPPRLPRPGRPGCRRPHARRPRPASGTEVSRQPVRPRGPVEERRPRRARSRWSSW